MNQNVILGIDKLPEILKKSNCKNIFLVVGSSSYSNLSIRNQIEALDVKRVKFSDFTPNPLFEQVVKGVELFKAEQCDGILAVGGGSALDVAKCVKLAVLAEEGDNVLIPPVVNKRVPCDGSQIPFIAIPTTAGSGSESTHNAVIYYNGAKQTVTNDAILPDCAVLEPSVLSSLPLYQKKCAMMDALCQGIESWWSVNSTEESFEYSRKAIELIVANWKSYIFDADNDAAYKIMLGANYSGKAINITQTTAAHAMSYKITSLFKIPHGHAVALCLPNVWQYMIQNLDKCIYARGKEYLEDIFVNIANTMGARSSKEAISLFSDMMEEMELRKPISNNKEADLNTLSISVNPVRLKNNPVALDESAIYGLYDVIVISK